MEAPVLGIIVVLVGIIGLVAGFFLRKYLGEAKVGFAEERAQKVLAETKNDGEAKKKEDLLEAKEQIHNLRAESDRENREVRKNLQRLEKRIVQGEESLANRLDEIGRREKALILEEQKITQRSS